MSDASLIFSKVRAAVIKPGLVRLHRWSGSRL